MDQLDAHVRAILAMFPRRRVRAGHRWSAEAIEALRTAQIAQAWRSIRSRRHPCRMGDLDHF